MVAREGDVLEHGRVRGAEQDLPYGSSRTSVGIRYSNIDPDHERRPASSPTRRTAGRARPSGAPARRPWRSPTGWSRAPPTRAGRRSRRRADARRPKADVEQAPPAVEEEAEVGLCGDARQVPRGAGAGPRRRRCRRSSRRAAPSARSTGDPRPPRRAVARGSAWPRRGSSARSPRARPKRRPAVPRCVPGRRGSARAARRRRAPRPGPRRRRARWPRHAARRSAATTRRGRACSGPVASGSRLSASPACASASKCVQRLPLSTVETYCGVSASADRVSYQLKKWPRWRGIVTKVASVASMRSIMSTVPIQPKRCAQAVERRYRPMLVGEVRCATMSLGTTCRLSGGRWLSSAPTTRSNRRQVSRPTSCSERAIVDRERAAALDRPRPADPPRPQRRQSPRRCRAALPTPDTTSRAAISASHRSRPRPGRPSACGRGRAGRSSPRPRPRPRSSIRAGGAC